MSKHKLTTLLALLVAAGAASAQTVTVTTCYDDIDIDYWAGAIADLPGPDGKVSFPEALLATDNTPGHQTINFEIPPSEWWLSSIYPGQVMLQSMFSWSASDSVTIDGTTQTAFTGDTFPGGWEISLDGLQLYLGGDGSSITGFHDSNVWVSGSNSRVFGNTGGMYIVVYNGSGSVVSDNEAWTIKVDRSNDNVIVRNTTDRIRIDGHWGGGLPATNNRVGGPDPADRNFITGWGNYGEHGVPGGTTLELFDTLGTLVQNNYIGTTPDGLAIGNPASTAGVSIEGINQDLLIRDNLIATRAVGVYPVSGVPYGSPIYIQAYGGYDGFSNHVEIYGNTLGLNANGEPLLGGVNGIVVSRYAQEYAQDFRIGGSGPGQGNVIAGHDSTAVFMEISPGVAPAAGVGIRVSGNSIRDNGGIGIDLTPNTWTFGPTANDPLDADVGANGLQNYPVVTSAHSSAFTTRVIGVLDTSPQDDFTLEFYASPACDPSGLGEGEVFLGSAGVSTDAAGHADFDVILPGAAPAGWSLTATATLEPLGRTSEFSACAPITGDHCQPALGFGGPGTAVLAVCGDVLTSGGAADLRVSAAPNGTPLLVFFGMFSNPTPILGGTLVPLPTALTVPLVTDPSGAAQLTIPGGSSAPVTVYAQALYLDTTLPQLIGFTNAVGMEFLP